MEIKLTGGNEIFSFNEDIIIDTLLKNRGFDDIEDVVGLHTDSYSSPSKLENIDYASELLKEAIGNKEKILVIVDSDTDGYTSSAMGINFIDEVTNQSLEIEHFIHKEKAHGVKDSFVSDDIDLVIVPDAGMNSLDEIIKIRDRGKKVIVLDHHPIPEDRTIDDFMDIDNVAFVNDKISPKHTNKEISGVGIVFKFCHYFNNKYELGIDMSKYLDLVAFGMTADYMDMSGKENRLLCKLGFEVQSNQFINALIKQREFNVGNKLNFTKVSMFIAPMINGSIRVGSQEEKDLMFKAFLDRYKDKTLEYRRRKADEPQDVPIYTDMARQCSNIKARQDNARRRIAKELEEIIEEEELYNNKIMFVPFVEGEDSSLVGLTAMEIANQYMKPTLVVNKNKDTGLFEGSGRNYNYSPIDSFKLFLQDTEKFKYVEGHDNAFGVGLPKSELDDMLDIVNTSLEDVNVGDKTMYVDFNINMDIHKLEDVILVVDTITSLEDEWSNGFEQPNIAITNFNYSSSDVEVMGKKRNTIKITPHPYIEIMFFRLTEDEVDDIVYGTTLDIVGRTDLNDWALKRGYKKEATRQIIANGYEVKK